jgi:hypothetical protein
MLVVLRIICMGRFYFGQVCLVSWRLPVPERTKLSQDLGNLCYYFIEYIMYPFGLYLFFFNAQGSQIWPFDGVTEFLYILFTALELFD